MNAKAYIEGLFKATPGLELYDISEGTNIYDLVVAPLMQIFEDAMETGDIASITEIRSWETMYDIPLDYLKNLAAIRGVTLSSLNKSSSLVTLHFSSPIDWTIPAGTTLSSGAVTFVTRDAVAITEGLISNNVDEKGLYCYYDLFVYNDSGINLAMNQLGFMSNAPAELMSITHPAITNGIADETAATIIEKLKVKDLSITASSSNSVKALINRYLPDVTMTVVTPGNTRMKRDMVYNMVPGTISPKQESTFLGKIRRDLISNSNKAYFTCLPTANVGDPAEFNDEDEFVQGQYLAINDAVDSSVTLSTENVMNETFTQSSEKIGESSALLSLNATYPRYLSVEDEGKFSAGDSVNIADRTSVQPTQNGIVEEVAEYLQTDAAYTLDAKTLAFDPATTFPAAEGDTIYIFHGVDDYIGVVDTVTVNGDMTYITLVDPIGTLVNDTVNIALRIVIGAAYTAIDKKLVFTPLTAFPGVHGDTLYIAHGTDLYESVIDTVTENLGEYTVILDDPIGALGNDTVDIATYVNEDVAYRVSALTVTFTPTLPFPVVPGSKLYVTHSNVEYECYALTVTEETGTYYVVLADPIGSLGSDTVDIAMYVVKLYNNLSVPITDYTGMYVDMVNAEGLYVGPGWIKSEHDMPIGTYISENQITVVNNELVMGTNLSEKEINVVKQIFLRYGISNMVTKIFENTTVKIGFATAPGQATETIYSPQEMER